MDYRSVDKAGNVEAYHTCQVRIDTVGPTCKALNASVKRGRAVKVWYDADDSRSSQVSIHLAIKTRSGVQELAWDDGYVKVLKPGWWWWRRFTCHLPKGTYRIEVTAKDLAGNTQTRKGVGKLVVK